MSSVGVKRDCFFQESLEVEEVFADAVRTSLAWIKQVSFQEDRLFSRLARIEHGVVDVVQTPAGESRRLGAIHTESTRFLPINREGHTEGHG